MPRLRRDDSVPVDERSAGHAPGPGGSGEAGCVDPTARYWGTSRYPAADFPSPHHSRPRRRVANREHVVEIEVLQCHSARGKDETSAAITGGNLLGKEAIAPGRDRGVLRADRSVTGNTGESRSQTASDRCSFSIRVVTRAHRREPVVISMVWANGTAASRQDTKKSSRLVSRPRLRRAAW